jgi:hypothetical protein
LLPGSLPAHWLLGDNGSTVRIPLGDSGHYAVIDRDAVDRVAGVSHCWNMRRGVVRACGDPIVNPTRTNRRLASVVVPELKVKPFVHDNGDGLDYRRTNIAPAPTKSVCLKGRAAPALPPEPPSCSAANRAVRANERAWGVDATAGLDAAELAEKPLEWQGAVKPVRAWAELWGLPPWVLAHRVAAGVDPRNFPMPPVELEDPTWWSPPGEGGPPFEQ